tara:strand:+ start:144 stop:305 length:162 start_codon:yes stop_codon:yes gene_type:complete
VHGGGRRPSTQEHRSLEKKLGASGESLKNGPPTIYPPAPCAEKNCFTIGDKKE